MTRSDFEAFVKAHVGAFGRRDPRELASRHAEHGTIVSPMFATRHGRKSIEDSYRALFTAFPDWHYTVDDFVVDPPRVAMIFKVTGTHVNEFFGLPGTGKRFEFGGVQYMKLEDGLVVEDRRIYDFTRLLVDMGILRATRARS